jgi:hypothetical protein
LIDFFVDKWFKYFRPVETLFFYETLISEGFITYVFQSLFITLCIHNSITQKKIVAETGSRVNFLIAGIK